MKTDLNSTIAGQPLKTVRAMLRDLGRGDYFTVESVEAFLHKQLWSDHVDDLAKQGKVSSGMRRLYKKSGVDQLKPQRSSTNWRQPNFGSGNRRACAG